MNAPPPYAAAETAVSEASDTTMLPRSPVVSVLMITYNHGEYLAEAIEGVLAQRCDFPFELVIGEDASTDDTRAIALDYQRRYPHVVRVVHGARNVGMNANGLRVFQRARGRYIAFCEGDDFWCAPDKLARQVALMESADEVGIVHTDWTKAVKVRGEWRYDLARSVHRRVADRFLRGDLSATWYFPKILRTCTVLCRRASIEALHDSPLFVTDYPFGDCILNAFIACRERVGYVPIVGSVYRVSPNSALRSGAEARVRFYEASLRFDSEAREYFASSDVYGLGYRWESAASLLLWALRARNWSAIGRAFRELISCFKWRQFLASLRTAISMRWPTLRRQAREIPKCGAEGRNKAC